MAIVSAGIVCSVGLTLPTSFAAIRAAISRFRETNFVDRAGQPIVGAVVPSNRLRLASDADGAIVGGEDKMARMLAMTVDECVGGAEPGETALMLVTPEADRAVLTNGGIRRCFTACETVLGRSVHRSSRAMQAGSPGVVDALMGARDLLLAGVVRSVLVAGLDNLLDASAIHEALVERRLLTSDNKSGFVPGEASACLLVRRAGDDLVPGRASLTVGGLGRAEEACTMQARARSTGVGLAKAMVQALTEGGLSAHDVHARFADISAEEYFFEEASYAWTRLLRAPSPAGYRLFTPVARVGHVGAAMGPLMLAIALEQARKGLSPGPNALIHLSSSGTSRGAVLVKSGEED